jgi:Fe2+ or Zn2+ uptake regulation protein
MASAPTAHPDLHATAAQRLRADGQRYTTGRRTLVTLLDEATRPLTIGELLELDRSLAQSSAYRNLAVLERSGVVHRLVTTDEFARFELAEDLTEHHHHLICSACGSMEDFTVSPQLESSLAKAFERVSESAGFQTQYHRLDLVGLCPTCR